MFNTEAPHINGKFLYYAFIAGGNENLQHQAEINRINEIVLVFITGVLS